MKASEAKENSDFVRLYDRSGTNNDVKGHKLQGTGSSCVIIEHILKMSLSIKGGKIDFTTSFL